jgi:hypothetical protein
MAVDDEGNARVAGRGEPNDHMRLGNTSGQMISGDVLDPKEVLRVLRLSGDCDANERSETQQEQRVEGDR